MVILLFFNDSLHSGCLGFSSDGLCSGSHVCIALMTLLLALAFGVRGRVSFWVFFVEVTWLLSLRFVVTRLAFASGLGIVLRVSVGVLAFVLFLFLYVE